MQIESIWVDIQFYNDQNPKIAVYRKNTTYTRPRRFAKKKQTKKTPWTIYNLQNDQAVYKYISTIYCWKAFRSYFCDESNVTWRGEIRVLIVIKQIGQTDLMVAKLSWKKFHLSNGIYIHLTHKRKILRIK